MISEHETAEKRRIRALMTDKLPAPKGSYSQAVRAGDFIFISGIVGVEPKTGAVSSDVYTQMGQVLTNMRTLIEEAGGAMSDVVKTTVFLADMQDYAALNEIYAHYFPEILPARSTVAAKPPADFLVEIEAVAYLPE